MHSILFLMLLAGSCLAHYRGSYDSQNLIAREEPVLDDNAEYVECPVCPVNNNPETAWPSSTEKCPIKIGNKKYKKCQFGTYFNGVCGGKLDCYMGPGEECTVKMEFDNYGKKCAPGFICNKSASICTGIGHNFDTTYQWINNRRFPGYTWRRSDKGQADETKDYEGIRN